MAKTIIIGHRNPDTDTVVSAIAAAEYLKAVWKIDTQAARSGELNNETRFILKAFSAEAPVSFKKLKKGEKAILVDHNEAGQRPEGIETEALAGIIDHHKLSLETQVPVFVRVEPVGSTSAIIAKMHRESGRKISSKVAKLLLAGILSDTLGLAGPTATDEDRKAVKELNGIAKLDLKVFIKDMFAAKSSLKGISTETLVTQDYKLFEMGGKKVGIGVWETTDPKSVEARKGEIVGLLEARKSKEKAELIFFFVVDIVKQESFLYAVSKDEMKAAEAAFGRKAEGDTLRLPGIASRKKQMVPMLERRLAK